MSEWNVQALEAGGHVVHHHDHETNEMTPAGTFGPEVTLGDLVALITERAADGDYILLPTGEPVVVLELPERGHGSR